MKRLEGVQKILLARKLSHKKKLSIPDTDNVTLGLDGVMAVGEKSPGDHQSSVDRLSIVRPRMSARLMFVSMDLCKLEEIKL